MIRIVTYRDVLDDPELRAILRRELTFDPAVESTVRAIIDDVRTRGDEAVIEYTEKFDHVRLGGLDPVPEEELRALHATVDSEFLDAVHQFDVDRRGRRPQ